MDERTCGPIEAWTALLRALEQHDDVSTGYKYHHTVAEVVLSETGAKLPANLLYSFKVRLTALTHREKAWTHRSLVYCVFVCSG